MTHPEKNETVTHNMIEPAAMGCDALLRMDFMLDSAANAGAVAPY